MSTSVMAASQVLAYVSVQTSFEWMNEQISHILLRKVRKPNKLILRGEEMANGSFSCGWDLSSTTSFPRSIKYRSLVLKAVPLEDVCIKQEHLIALTKIISTKHKPFSRSWNTSWSLQFLSRCGTWPLKAGWAVAQWVWDWGSKSHWVFPQEHPDPRGIRLCEQGQPQWSSELPAGQVWEAGHVIP